MPISVNDVLRVVAKMNLNDADDVQAAYNVVVGDMGTGTELDFIDLTTEWVNDIYSGLVDNLPDNLHFDSIEMFNITDNEPIGTFDWPTLTSGSSGAQHMPNSDTCYMFGRTQVPKCRGAKYMPGMTETAHNDGLWDTAFLASYANSLSNWITVAEDVVLDQVLIPVVQRTIGAPTLVENFVGGVVRAVVQPLLRRKIGRGS